MPRSTRCRIMLAAVILPAARVLVHEFFHNVEGLYRDRHRFLA